MHVISFVKRLWAAAPLATVILTIALAAGAFFAIRMVAFWIYWSDPARRDQEIAAWMTPGYIAHSWQVPHEVIFEALDAPRPPPDGPMSLRELAERRGTTVEALISDAEAAVAAYRAGGAQDD